MNAINDFLLSIFAEPNKPNRTYLSEDGRVYASDGYVCISIPQSELVLTYPDVTTVNPHRVQALHKVFTDFDKGACRSTTVSVASLAEILSKAQLISDNYTIKCKECDGGGTVEYEYTASDGSDYSIDNDCPICDGSGRIEKSPLFPRIYMTDFSGSCSSDDEKLMYINIGPCFYKPFNIYRLFMVAAIKGYKEIELFYCTDHSTITAASFGNVKVIFTNVNKPNSGEMVIATTNLDKGEAKTNQ